MLEITSIEILGLVAGALTATASVPQIIKIIKLKDAQAVSVFTWLILVGSYILWLIYGIVQASIAIIVSNVVSIALGGTVLFLKLFVWKE